MNNICIYTEVFINQEQQKRLNIWLRKSELDVSDVMQKLLVDYIENLPSDNH